MAAGGIARLATWLIRVFQLLFAIILVGILSYMIDQYHDYGEYVPREVVVPQVFSVLAMVVCFFSIIAICFLGYTLQLVAAFLDFVIFVGYLTSAGLLRHNFHGQGWRNPLRGALSDMRTNAGYDSRNELNNSIVKLLVGLVIIQIFLFFITSILSVFVARRTVDDKTGREKARRRGHTAV